MGAQEIIFSAAGGIIGVPHFSLLLGVSMIPAHPGAPPGRPGNAPGRAGVTKAPDGMIKFRPGKSPGRPGNTPGSVLAANFRPGVVSGRE